MLLVKCKIIFWTVNPNSKITTSSNVIVAPGGVPKEYDEMSPVKILNNEMIIAVAKTILKPFVNLIANAAGKTNKADTRRTPIVGMIIEIANPVIMLKDKERRLVLIPLVYAVSSSNVIKYNGLLKIKKYSNITMVTPTIVKTWVVLIVTMEPKRNWSIFVVIPPSVMLIKNKAKLSPAAINIAIETSE